MVLVGLDPFTSLEIHNQAVECVRINRLNNSNVNMHSHNMGMWDALHYNAAATVSKRHRFRSMKTKLLSITLLSVYYQLFWE